MYAAMVALALIGADTIEGQPAQLGVSLRVQSMRMTAEGLVITAILGLGDSKKVEAALGGSLPTDSGIPDQFKFPDDELDELPLPDSRWNPPDPPSRTTMETIINPHTRETMQVNAEMVGKMIALRGGGFRTMTQLEHRSYTQCRAITNGQLYYFDGMYHTHPKPQPMMQQRYMGMYYDAPMASFGGSSFGYSGSQCGPGGCP